MVGEFANKVVMVTGAVGAVGSTVVERFAAEGASLILFDHNQAKIDQAADQLRAAHTGIDVLGIAGDATDPESVERMMAAVELRFGRIDVLAHTIGGFAFGDPVYAMDLNTVDKMFALNVRPIYVLVGRVVKAMLDTNTAGKVAIILARAAIKGAANSSAYNASKAAAQSIMESLSLEVRDKGINVNGVLPSIIDTPANRASMEKADFSKWVTRDDIADAILFLSSDKAKSLHGVSLEVYGRA